MKLKNGQNINNIILSFPRSGNHWVRYIVEYFSKKRTLGCGDWEWGNTIDGPIFSRIDNEDYYKDNSYIAVKRHTVDFNVEIYNILLIIRNYKEVGIRMFNPKRHVDAGVKKSLKEYMSLIGAYDKCKNNKNIIYYEDLMKSPESEINKIIKFFNIKNADVNKFMENYETNKKKCIKIYDNLNGSRTKGNDIRFYSKKSNPIVIKEYDDFILKTYPKLANKYLSRYKEI